MTRRRRSQDLCWGGRDWIVWCTQRREYTYNHEQQDDRDQEHTPRIACRRLQQVALAALSHHLVAHTRNGALFGGDLHNQARRRVKLMRGSRYAYAMSSSRLAVKKTNTARSTTAWTIG